MSIGFLTIAHIYGAAPFPCPRPCVGGGVRGSAHFLPPYLLLDSPKAVLAEYFIFWRVVNVQRIGSLGVLACCILREALLWNTRF